MRFYRSSYLRATASLVRTGVISDILLEQFKRSWWGLTMVDLDTLVREAAMGRNGSRGASLKAIDVLLKGLDMFSSRESTCDGNLTERREKGYFRVRLTTFDNRRPLCYRPPPDPQIRRPYITAQTPHSLRHRSRPFFFFFLNLAAGALVA
jgi:hypothetical protein